MLIGCIARACVCVGRDGRRSIYPCSPLALPPPPLCPHWVWKPANALLFTCRVRDVSPPLGAWFQNISLCREPKFFAICCFRGGGDEGGEGEGR